MPFLPVAAREVREASRQPRTYRWRWVTAAVGLGLMGFVFWVSSGRAQGHDLFVAISTAAYIYCLLAGAMRTADTIAEEKRDNTLGLLFLTDLKGWDIILGKLLSSSANCFFGLLALFPMLAIPLLMGGVPPDQFAKVILNLLNTLFLSLSWGFLISALFRHAVVTISMSLLLMIFFGGVVPLIGIYIHEEWKLRELSRVIWFFTPTQAHANSFGPPNPAEFNHYWMPLVVGHVIGWINLRLAIYFLPRLWQDTPKNKRTERWRERIRAWRFGQGKKKVRFRTRLLDQNPLFWLANREQVSSMGLMILISIVLIGAMLIALSNNRGRFDLDEVMIGWMLGVGICHLLIAFRMTLAASHRLADDRRSGALELLLATELSIRDLMRGHWMALGRQFFGPILIVTLAAVFGFTMILEIISKDSGYGGGLLDTLIEMLTRIFRNGARAEDGLAFLISVSIQLMLMINWIALISVGMWFGLREKRSGFSVWSTLALVFLPPWITLIIGFATLEEAGAFRNSADEDMMRMILGSGWITGLCYLGFLTVWANRNLTARFRAVASDRYAGPRPFPWAPIGKFALRFAGGVALLCLIFIGYRAYVNQRGDKAWQAALAEYPQFAQSFLKEPNPPYLIPPDENLARAPLFDALATGRGRNRKQMRWDLSQINGTSDNNQLSWNWAQNFKFDVGRLHQLYSDQKIISTNSTNKLNAVLGILRANYETDLQQLRAEGRSRPRVRFHFEAVRTTSTPRPYYPLQYAQFVNDPRSIVRPVIDTLSVVSCLRIAAGEDAFEDVILGLRLADGLSHEPQAVLAYHEALLSMTQPIYDGLGARRWKNEQIKRVQDHYSAIDLWTPYDAFRKDFVRRTLEDSERFVQQRKGESRSRDPVLQQLPYGFIRETQANFLHWGLKETPRPIDLKERRIDFDLAKKIQETRPDASTRQARYQDQYLQSLRSLAFTQTTIDQIIVACAVERFLNDHRRLPQKLDELVPKYIAAIPKDVFDGKPLRYQMSFADQYQIYSVGADRQDDNGRISPIGGSWAFWQDFRTGDFVWTSEPKEVPEPQKRRR